MDSLQDGPRCTIVVPCYNEADRLDVRTFCDYMSRSGAVDFVMVNDGSSDRTLDILNDLAERCPGRVRVLDLEQNSGKAEAVRRGMVEALSEQSGEKTRQADAVGYWDADLATPLDTIDDFFRKLNDSPRLQIVTGARVKMLGRNIDRKQLRHFPGRVFATFASMTLRLAVYDTQCGAKMFRNSVAVRRMFDQPFCTNWVFDVELYARLLSGGGPQRRELVESIVHEYPLTTWIDVDGSKVRPTDFFRGLVELLRIRRKYLTRAKSAYIESSDFPKGDFPKGDFPKGDFPKGRDTVVKPHFLKKQDSAVAEMYNSYSDAENFDNQETSEEI